MFDPRKNRKTKENVTIVQSATKRKC